MHRNEYECEKLLEKEYEKNIYKVGIQNEYNQKKCIKRIWTKEMHNNEYKQKIQKINVNKKINTN